MQNQVNIILVWQLYLNLLNASINMNVNGNILVFLLLTLNKLYMFECLNRELMTCISNCMFRVVSKPPDVQLIKSVLS